MTGRVTAGFRWPGAGPMGGAPDAVLETPLPRRRAQDAVPETPTRYPGPAERREASGPGPDQTPIMPEAPSYVRYGPIQITTKLSGFLARGGRGRSTRRRCFMAW